MFFHSINWSNNTYCSNFRETNGEIYGALFQFEQRDVWLEHQYIQQTLCAQKKYFQDIVQQILPHPQWESHPLWNQLHNST